MRVATAVLSFTLLASCSGAGGGGASSSPVVPPGSRVVSCDASGRVGRGTPDAYSRGNAGVVSRRPLHCLRRPRRAGCDAGGWFGRQLDTDRGSGGGDLPGLALRYLHELVNQLEGFRTGHVSGDDLALVEDAAARITGGRCSGSTSSITLATPRHMRMALHRRIGSNPVANRCRAVGGP
jgi:hypothetical protein